MSADRNSAAARVRRQSGLAAEEAVARFLEARGWRTLARNHVVRGGELDLVMNDGPVLVFVEVRRRRRTDDALASLSPKKLARIVRAAEQFLAEAALGDLPVRFDVVAASPRPDGSFDFVHLENAFDASDASRSE